MPLDASTFVRRLCLDQGFALVGISNAEVPETARAFEAWLDAGHHGSMTYMETHREIRTDPQRFLDGVRAFVMVGDQYARRGDERSTDGGGRLARYARGRDYHKVMKTRLHAVADAMTEQFPGTGTRAFVDSAPVLEREFAARAGLGWIAKNTMLIHPTRGSYLFLGGLATTIDLVPSSKRIEDHCGSCTRCLDACPTQCLTPYQIDGSRCISYLTIEHRDIVPPDQRGDAGDWLFGCDICQEVCPHNSPFGLGRADTSPRPEYDGQRSSLDPIQVLSWRAEDRLDACAGTPMTRAKLSMMRRNAAFVVGHRRDRDAIEGLERLLADGDESEKDAARWALERIR